MSKLIDAILATRYKIRPFSGDGLLPKVFNAISQPYLERSDSELDIANIDTEVIDRLGVLWDRSHKYMRSGRLGLASRTLNQIIAIDANNAAAHNRLGIIEAKKGNYALSINYFETAVSIEPSASAFHNLGLILFESQNYKASVSAFKKSIQLEPSLAARYIAYAKANEMLGNDTHVLQALQTAVKLEYSKETLGFLLDFYKERGMNTEAAKIKLDIKNVKRRVVSEEDTSGYEDVALGLLSIHANC